MFSKLLFILVLMFPISVGAQTLLWNANPEPDIAGYIVYRGEASRTYTLATDVGKVTSTPIPLPDPTKRYYFAIRAYNTSKAQSELSAEVQSTPTTPITCGVTLGGPTAIPSGTAVGDISVVLSDPSCSWSASSSVSWLTLSASIGAGTQTIRFTAQANTLTTTRSATVMVQPVATGVAAMMIVTQDAAPPTPVECPGQFKAEYFSSVDLTGAPTSTICESSLNHDWGIGGPPNTVADDFSARWTGTFQLAGVVTFTARTDDGMRVWLDDDSVIDAWSDQGATTYQVVRNVTNGPHVVRVDYYERSGDAVAELTWATTPTPICSYVVSQPTTFVRQGGSQTVRVSTQAGCAWSAVESVGWLSVSPTSGVDSGTFRLTAQRFNGRGTRSTTMTVGGVGVVVRQQGR